MSAERPTKKATPLSPLVLLGSLGTAVSTLSMLPHLLHAARARKPSGSAGAWLLGALSGSIWMVYGVASGNLLVAAPSLVSVPAGLFLSVWCLVRARGSGRSSTALRRPLPAQGHETVQAYAVPGDLWRNVPDDTLEMPRLVGV